jgi:hypothetical protein
MGYFSPPQSRISFRRHLDLTGSGSGGEQLAKYTFTGEILYGGFKEPQKYF